MPKIFPFLLALLPAVSPLLAQEAPSPYDQLSRNNIRVDAKIESAGTRTDSHSLKTNYGTYIKNMSTTKEIVLSMHNPPADLQVEAFAVIKDYRSQKQRVEKLEVETLSPAKYGFIIEAEKIRERWMYAEDGKVSQKGNKVLGWLARVIRDKQIVGVAASGPQYEGLAKDPAKLSSSLTDSD